MELRQILDLTPLVIGVFGPNREPLYANRITLDYLGLSLDEWRLGSLASNVHPDDLERLDAAAERALSTGSPFGLVVRVPKADGSYRWFLVRYNPVRDDNGKICRWYAAATDIDDRKRAEDKIREQETELRQILDLTPQVVAVFGPSSERLYANRMALDYLGLSRAAETQADRFHRQTSRSALQISGDRRDS